jgi:mannose-6-phosphate isomerase-like protein (cupin superfamily)
MIRKADAMRVQQRESMRGGAGTITLHHCFEKEDITAPARLCARLVIPPGAGIGPHTHENEDEVFIVTRGTGILDDGRAETEVHAGDAILTGNGESHAIRNPGGEDLEIIAVIMQYA